MTPGFRSIVVALGVAASLLAGAASAVAEKRVALVIGNSRYTNTQVLSNPINDADDVAVAVKRFGFEVIDGRDLDKRGMDLAIARFGRAVQDADVALFFYAGHAMQFAGGNFLMPTDARLEDEFSVAFEMSRVDDIVNVMGRAKGVKILLLDACRNNPLAEQMRSRSITRDIGQTRGLAKLDDARGMVIAFATQPHQVAADGVGRNSPFTRAFLQEVGDGRQEIGLVFRRVTAEVNRLTGGKQVPNISDSLIGEFYFIKGETDAQIAERQRLERERLGREQAEAAARLAREEAERERLAKEQADRARISRELAEQVRLQQELVAEKARLEREAVLRQIDERERQAREAADRLRQQLAGLPGPGAPPVVATPPGSVLPADVQKPRPPATPVQPVIVVPPPVKVPPIGPLAVLQSGKLPTLGTDIKPVEAVIPPLAGAPLVLAIKKELGRVGCYVGALDARWGNGPTTRALADFAKHAGLPTPPSDPATSLLDLLKSKPDRVCPLVCGPGQSVSAGICIAVAKPPPVRQPKPAVEPDDEPVKPVIRARPIVKPLVKPARPVIVERPRPTPRPTAQRPTGGGGGGGRCFAFNGQRFCE